MRKIFLLVSLCIIAFASCSKDNESSISPAPTPTPTPGTKITYNANTKAIFDSNCTGCHNSGGQAPALNSYTGAKNNITNIVDRIQRTGAGQMPPSSKMSQTNIDLIKQWQTDGLLEN